MLKFLYILFYLAQQVKLIVCIVGGVIAVIMCVQLYLELCNTYMSAPFKVITFVLGLILVVSILRIIVCNETK